MTLTEWLATWVILAVVVAPFIGEWLHKRRVNREFRSHLDREARIQRPLTWNTTQLRTAVESDLKESAFQANARKAEALIDLGDDAA